MCTQALELLCSATGAMACEAVLGWWRPSISPSGPRHASKTEPWVVPSPPHQEELDFGGPRENESKGEVPADMPHSPGVLDTTPASPRGCKRDNKGEGQQAAKYVVVPNGCGCMETVASQE